MLPPHQPPSRPETRHAGPGDPFGEGFPLLRGRWKWFERLRQGLGMAIEVFDPSLQCILEAVSDRHLDRALRATLEAHHDARVREAADTALRTAAACSFTAEGLRIRLFPLFTGADSTKTPAGLLAIADVPSEESAGSDAALRALDQRLDSVGHWLGAAIEATIDSARHDLEQSQAAQRLAGIVEVVGALGQIEDEAQVIQLTMQAAALWYDADVRVYRRDVDGSFVLDAKLPGVDGHVPSRLPGSLITGRDQVFRLETSLEAEEFGWDRPAGDTLFVPVSVEDSTEWLIAVSGAADALAVPTLIFLHRLLEPLLENLDGRARGRFRQKLASIMAFGDAPFESTARIGLDALGRETGASSIQLAVTFDGGRRPPLTITWPAGQQDLRLAASDTAAADSGRSERVTAMAAGAVVELTLHRSNGAFPAGAFRLAHTAAEVYGLWLSGVLIGRAQTLVPQPSEYSPELLGRLRGFLDDHGCINVGGAVAVVLPQPALPTGVQLDEVMQVLQDHVRSSDVTGMVESRGAGVLLSNASESDATVVAGRLLRAARRRGLRSARVGATTFAASTEVPERLLSRAFERARAEDTTGQA